MILVKGYKTVINDLYEAGCRNIQFDDCVWGGLVNLELALQLTGETEERLPQLMEKLVELNNRVIEGKPEDLIINSHICRGNYHSTYFSSGAYDYVAKPLFGEENIDAYYLEYDDERSGSFEALKEITGEKKVVLGLITTKKS